MTTSADSSIQEQRLDVLRTIAMNARVDEPNEDYYYEEVAERLDGSVPIEQFVAISADETYTFVHFARTLEQAAEILADRVTCGTGNIPVAVIDLDTRVSYAPVPSIALQVGSEESWYLQ